MVRLAWILAVIAAACIQPRSKTCTDICARESDCVTSTNSQLPFDEKECVAACEVLLADPQNLAKVEQHKACVLGKASCSDVLECP